MHKVFICAAVSHAEMAVPNRSVAHLSEAAVKKAPKQAEEHHMQEADLTGGRQHRGCSLDAKLPSRGVCHCGTWAEGDCGLLRKAVGSDPGQGSTRLKNKREERGS